MLCIWSNIFNDVLKSPCLNFHIADSPANRLLISISSSLQPIKSVACQREYSFKFKWLKIMSGIRFPFFNTAVSNPGWWQYSELPTTEVAAISRQASPASPPRPFWSQALLSSAPPHSLAFSRCHSLVKEM